MAQAVEFRVGEEVPVYPRLATLVPPPQGYPWGSPHNDEYALTVLGFRGALVLGQTLLAYMSEFMVHLFGADWFTSGKISCRFVGGGVCHGDNLALRARVMGVEPDGNRERVSLEIWLEREDGQTTVSGSANCLR